MQTRQHRASTAIRTVVSLCPWTIRAAIIVTFAANVPISYPIDTLDPAGPDAGARWAGLYDQWVWANHLRRGVPSAPPPHCSPACARTGRSASPVRQVRGRARRQSWRSNASWNACVKS